MSRHFLPGVLASVLFGASAFAQQNLVPNWNFAGREPLKSWRVDFPWQTRYQNNAARVKQTTMEGKRCAVIELPSSVAGEDGGKIEAAFAAATPGATYRVEAEALLPDFRASIHAEAYAADPRDASERGTASESKAMNTASIPARDGLPALVRIFRESLPEPPRGQKWVKVEHEFTLPQTGLVAGKAARPLYLTVKAFIPSGARNGGKAYFTDFKLFKIKDPPPGAVKEKPTEGSREPSFGGIFADGR